MIFPHCPKCGGEWGNYDAGRTLMHYCVGGERVFRAAESESETEALHRAISADPEGYSEQLRREYDERQRLRGFRP